MAKIEPQIRGTQAHWTVMSSSPGGRVETTVRWFQGWGSGRHVQQKGHGCDEKERSEAGGGIADELEGQGVKVPVK